MELPVQMTFRNMDHSDEVEALIREKASQLDSFYDRIIRCRVLVEVPHHRQRSGNPYHVRIDLTVPGGQLAISREPAHENAYLALREAFDDARRQLQDYARRQRGQVKTHAVADGSR